MSKLVENYQNNFIDNIKDFYKFWYEGSRFNFKPFAGYVHEEYKSKNFNINASGFRSKEDFNKKLKSKKKIFFFGSSGLVGIPNLSDEETLTAITEKKLRERNKDYDVFNFGLICSRINSEFALITEMLSKYNPEAIVISTGFNDLRASYHGLEFGHYTDINNIMTYGFDHEKNKNNIVYGLDTLMETLINFSSKFNFINGRDILKKSEKMLQKRRKSLKKLDRNKTYEINMKMFLSLVEMLFYHLSSLKVKTIFVYQSSLLVTKKNLTKYEREYFDNYNDMDMYKNSNKNEDQKEMIKYFTKIQNQIKIFAEKFNIDFISHEEELCRENELLEPVFFDNVHLTKFGTEHISDRIISKINKLK